MERERVLARTLSPGCVGSAYSTVQSAINASADDDIVEVCPGTYNERLTIVGKDITLTSRDGLGTVTINAGSVGKGLAISGGAEVIVSEMKFINGSTTGTGANLYCTGSGLELRDSELADGTGSSGGGLGATGCWGIVEGNDFTDNTATYRGGGAYINGDSLDFVDNTVTANDAASLGGGLYLDGDSDLLDNTFDANHSGFNGGGAYVNWGYGDISGNSVVANTSIDDGAGIYVSHGAPLVSGNTFDDNDSDDEGGGLRVKLASPVIEDNVFTGNHADYRGGAMKVSHDEVTMTGNTYTANTTWVTGGAVLLYESASVLTDEVYTDNEAENGGALAILAGWGGVVLEDCTFDGNEADEDGGHLYIDLPGHTVTLRRVDLVDGSADDGGAVYATGTDIQFENTLFDGNVASVSGGALYLDAVTGDIENTVSYTNSAPEGSAITLVNSSAALDITNSVFRSNTTGSALKMINGAVPRVRYNDFSGNSSTVSGMAPVVGVNGNISATPSFVSPTTGNFALLSTSALINVGDPVIWDTNGTRSDIGLFGGPQAY